ncbi:MAG: gliding motility-associated C-terminal domain-containing protein [Chitinophagaceae bacterium]|nr:gliding motility-associated C-terminal domain-containing protein [Chitinophagaceae bacterium]
MIRKLLFIFLSIVLVIKVGHAQNYVWAQGFGNTKSDKAITVRTDSAGYIYTSGYFSDTITLGTNALLLGFTANATSKEAFLAKYDSLGFCLWARSGGEHFDDRVLGMDVDDEGNSVITGTFWQTGAGFQMGTVNVTGAGFGGGDQCFIVKHDKNGNQLWGNFVSSNSGDDQGLDVALDPIGNVYVVGFMTGTTLNVGGGVVTATNPNPLPHRHSYWLAKFDPNGVPQWARTFGHLPWDPTANKYVERDIAVAVDDSGGVYITGGYDSIRQFGSTTLTPVGGQDVFVMKYDTSGNFQWATNAGSDQDDWANGICSDKHGYIYIVGEHRDSLIMDTVLVKNYDKRDLFIFKIDAKTGKPIWGKRAGSIEGGERGNDVWADTNCNIYVAGDINSGAKFGDNIIIPPGKDLEAFVAKIAPDGKWVWAITGGALDGEDRGNSIVKGKGAQLYSCGYFRANATYGPFSLNSVGSSDAFLARLNDSILNFSGAFALSKPIDTLLCPGENTILLIPEHEYFEYNPTTGVVAGPNNSGLTFSPLNTTTYTLSGFSKGACPQYDTIVFTIEVAQNASAFFTISDSVICLGEPILFKDSLGNSKTFTWDFGDGSILANVNNPQHTYNEAGNYTIQLTSTSTFCPPVSYSRNVQVNAYPTISLGQDTMICPGVTAALQLSNVLNPASILQWSNGDISNSLTVTQPGTYWAMASNSNGECSSTDTIKINRDCYLNIPNSFSPNGDGTNDYFLPRELLSSGVKVFSMDIYNRWGEKIFSTTSLNGRGWDGKYNGVIQPMDTYIYIIDVMYANQIRKNFKGNVTLVR